MQAMLNNLVELSKSIALTIERERSPLSTAGRTGPEALRTQEIERVVRRVESHFTERITQLEEENRRLESENHQLRSTSVRDGSPGQIPVSALSPSVRGCIRDQEQALNELDRAWCSECGDHSREVEYLRQVLIAEKRQRLLVEEQTQSLTEQHAKVVSTLERRLQKQEEQLRDLINAVDRSHGNSDSTSPSQVSSPGALVTPRHLLRQQLAQHQQTTRALQQYRKNLAPNTVPTGGDDDLGTLDLGDMKGTLESIKRSQPPVVNTHESRTTTMADVDTSENASKAVSHRVAREVDEITAFLDNITKELESLGADDDLQ